MLNESHHNDLFKDYYFNNKGILFKSFELNINNINNSYDIYWGDPNIIFDRKTLISTFPLAVTIIPKRLNYPNPRIFLHDKLDKNIINVFEMVITHEIGHIWLHDIVGFNNLSTSYYMDENESEVWADYFSYYFFKRYRNIDCLNKYQKILEEVSELQIKIYYFDPKLSIEVTLTNKMDKLKILEDKIKLQLLEDNSFTNQMIEAINITLKTMGDIFK
jgi:hypothetical protein